MNAVINTVPKVNLTIDNVAKLQTELTQYSNIYHNLFVRREQKEQYKMYFQGLMLNLPNKSVETMMLNLNGGDPNTIRNMQHFLSQGSWKDEAILARHWQEVSHDLGDSDGVLIVDGSDFPKQGKDSVGVKRQWCGQLGKRANCQAGIFLGYASQYGRTLLDRRLYLPKEWVEDAAYAKRRAKCGVPKKITFKTKPALAAEMVNSVHADKTLPFRWLTCDEAFGRDTSFLDSVAAVVWYFAEVPKNTHIWQTRPQTDVPTWSGKGRKPTREQLVSGESKADTVENIANALTPDKWVRRDIKEGSKGTITADFAMMRVVAVRNKLPGPDVWLVFRRDPTSGEIHYFLSNAPIETDMTVFAWISGMRWPIETCFEESKQEIGLGDYQVRSWKGWHHHMTLCILAHFFLVRIRLKLKDEVPKLTLPQAILLLKAALAQPQPDAVKAIDIVNYYQQRHHAAYLSHRKRRLTRKYGTEVSL